MKLSIYLFREEVTSFEGFIQQKYLQGESAFHKLTPSKVPPYECVAYIQQNKTKEPRWLSFLSTHFETEELRLQNASNSFVLLLKAEGRIFAVTFGYGFNALNRSAIEPGFGLRASLNAFDATQLRTLDTRNTDLVTRQRRTHVSVGSPVTEFGLNLNRDWVRYVAGKPTSVEVAKSLSGSDSLAISCDCDLENVGEKCIQLLRLYQSDTYKARFAFVDHIQPLSRGDPLVEQLNTDLQARIDARSQERLTIAYPELPDYELLDVYRLRFGRKHRDLEELSLSEVYEFLDSQPGIPSLTKTLSVVGLDIDEKAVTHRNSLHDYLVCEIERGGETYILSLGKWFRAETDYVKYVRQSVAGIEDITNDLALPMIIPGEPEGTYNARMAKEKNWLLLDKALFPIRQSYDKIEVCDILSADKRFICVKKMRSSATLSHLFAQGSVSATLLRESSEYRAKITELACPKWPEITFDGVGASYITFVYAIPTDKQGSLSSCMFFFSLVNLLEHAQAITRVGFRVALCKIEYGSVGVG